MYLDRLFKLMADKQASDLFISCGAPINIKVNGIVASGVEPADGRRDGAPHRLRPDEQGAGARVRERDAR